MYEIVIRAWAKWDRVRGSSAQSAGTQICVIVVMQEDDGDRLQDIWY